MAKLLEWFIANRLSLNLDKTCCSMFEHHNEDVAVFKIIY